MEQKPYITKQLHELLYRALETERGDIKVYKAALACAQNEDLKGEWEKYLEHTQRHERVLLKVFEDLGLDPEAVTPGREVVAHIGHSLVTAMKMATAKGSAETAQLVAGECVLLAETKNHQNWELIGHLAGHGKGKETGTLKAAFEAVEQEHDYHLYHTEGFSREWGCRSALREQPTPPS